jgi:peptide/nickel transport system substrate-binding protein
LAEAETGKDFVLPHLGRLEGVVSSSDTGEVFENVEVTAFNETSYFKAWSQTDGFYGLDLPIGDYWIVYNLSDEVTDNEGWELNEGFHGDQWDFSSAVSVTVPFYNNDPVNTLVVDKVMTRFPRLHGRIVDSSTSLPIAGARVVVVKQDLPQFIFNHSTNCTDETGEYILPHIDPGETLVTVLGACGNAWSFHPYTTTITFNDGDDVLLDVALTPGSIEEQFTVRVDDPGDFTPLTGLFVSNYGGSNNDVTPLLFTPLVALNDQHQWFSELLQQVPLEINGGVVISGNQMVVTYQLKSGLLWSDGHPLTSEDIQYVWQYYQRPQFWMDTYLLQINPLFKIERIETPNTLTAVVYYKPEEFPSNYLEALPYTYPKHVLENIPWVFHRWTSEFSHKPVGNGPYIVADFLPGVYANLIPNPNYHKQLSGYPKIQNMRLIFGEHPFYCLVNNDCDVSINIGNYVPANYTDYDLQVIKTASTTYEELHLNLDLPLFQDIKVRQALAYALNNEGFFQDDTINITADTWMPVDNPVFLDKGYSKYSFNLGQAAALLASAGWVDTDSDGILEKDGEELTFTLTYIGSNILRQNMALMYQEDLETIGVKLILDPRDDWWESARRGELDSFISGWIFDTFSEVLGFGLFHSSSIPTAYNNYQGSNLNRWQNSVNDVILENARVELDQVTLKNLYGDQLLVYGDQVPGIPTRWYARTDGAIPILLNFKPTQSIPVTWNAEQWEVPANPYDASVSKVLSVDSPAPIPGAVITYVITAKNAGYFPLDGYTILDELSDKVTYLGAIPAPSSISGNKLYWNMGTVPGKTTLPLIKVRVQVLETAVYGDILTNKVQVYSNQIDNRPSNNAFFHTTQVLGNVDLDINKSGVGLPIVGEDFDYYITYANWGGAPATDVVITDTLPAGVTYLGATPTPSNIDGNELIWNIGTLPGNQFGGQIIIHTQVSDSGVILNEAEIACSEAGSLSDDHTENVTDIAEPLITQPTSGTADGTPTLEGLAPPDSVVDFYDLTSLMKADQMGIDNPLAESWVASTTATVDGTFTLELALPEGTYSIFARSSKSTLTSDMSNVATFNVKHDLDIDPDYVQVSSRGVVISNGVVRAERRTLAFEVLDIQAQLSCSANPSAMLQVIENGMFYYNIPPYATSDIGGGNWLVKFRYYLGNLHSSYEIKLKWNCSGTPYEEVLIFILIDPDGYLYDQVEVDAGSAIEDALILNGIITAYVSTPDGWKIWPADVYGQYNPQWTDEETEDGVLVAGYYSFLTPPGLYRLEAFSPGYQPYQSPVLTVLNEPIHLDIGLLPLTGGSGALISPANLSASSKMVDQAEAWVGDILTYDLYVVNTGGLESSSLDVVDSLHAAVSYVDGSITTSGGGSAVYNEVDRTIEWSGSVPAGSQIHIHYKVLVATTGGDPFEISTSAALTGEQEDLAGVGDLKTSTWVLNQVGVMLVNDESGEAELGKSVTYQHTITNTGNFTDTFTFEAVSSLGWTVEIPDPIMLGAGESIMVEVVIYVPEGADEGDIDSTTLTVSSNMAPAYQDSVQLTTTALEKQDYLLYLPLTLRP